MIVAVRDISKAEQASVTIAGETIEEAFWVESRRGHAASARGHAYRSIEPDHFPVQHWVSNNRLYEQGILRGMTKPVREWCLLAEFLERGFRHFSECRSKEQARRDRHHANGKLGQIAGDRQSHSDDAAFGRGIRRLTDLTFEGSNAGGVDNDATLFADGVGAMQARGEFGNHVECSNQIDIEDATKVCQRKGLPLTIDGSNRLADTRTIDQDPCRSVRSDSGVEPGRHAVLVGNIDKKELAPYRSSDLSALVRVPVEDRNLRTQGRQAGGGGR